MIVVSNLLCIRDVKNVLVSPEILLDDSKVGDHEQDPHNACDSISLALAVFLPWKSREDDGAGRGTWLV